MFAAIAPLVERIGIVEAFKIDHLVGWSWMECTVDERQKEISKTAEIEIKLV